MLSFFFLFAQLEDGYPEGGGKECRGGFVRPGNQFAVERWSRFLQRAKHVYVECIVCEVAQPGFFFFKKETLENFFKTNSEGFSGKV